MLTLAWIAASMSFGPLIHLTVLEPASVASACEFLPILHAVWPEPASVAGACARNSKRADAGSLAPETSNIETPDSMCDESIPSVNEASCASDTKIVTLKTPPDVHEPQAAVDTKGHVFVVYATTKLVSMSVSNDSGATFGDSISVGEIGKISIGMRRGPRVAAAPNSVVVSAIGGARGDGHDGDLVAWRSTTAGVSWGAAVRVSDYPGCAREGLHAMAAGPKGEVACAWLDVRSGKTEIFSAFSHDEGTKFEANRLVYHSPDGSVCECCHPSIAFDAHGSMYVMFRNQLDGARDMYITESKDGGKHFDEARKLGSGTWKIAACPMDGGALAIDAAGQVTSIWRREGEIYCAELGAANGIEHKEKPGEQPWITSGEHGFFSTWLTRRGGELWILAPKTDAPVKLGADAIDPMIASSPDGKGPVIAVWESIAHDASAISVARFDQSASAVKDH